MIIYNKVPVYDKHTGKPTGRTEPVAKEVRCDFTGVLLNEENDSEPYCTYKLDYGWNDSCMGASGDEYEFGQKYNINLHEFLGEDYAFYVLSGGFANEQDSAEIAMMKYYLSFPIDNMDTPTSFDSMCRSARIRAATKLLEEGTIKPENLAGWYPSDE